ncbi:hypothetical protein JCM3766R1_001051 [Sporobolomyces carnicolor]
MDIASVLNHRASPSRPRGKASGSRHHPETRDKRQASPNQPSPQSSAKRQHLAHAHGTDPLYLVLERIVKLLHDSDVADGWKDSIWLPLLHARSNLTGYDDESAAAEAEKREKTVTEELTKLEGMLRLPAQHQGSAIQSGLVPPMEQITWRVDIPNEVLPDTSWFRDKMAELNFQSMTNTFETKPKIPPSRRSDRFQTGIALLQGFKTNRESNKYWSKTLHAIEQDWEYYDYACEEWKVLFEMLEREGGYDIEEEKMIRLLEIVKSIVRAVMHARVVHPRFWHLWIPRAEWLRDKLDLPAPRHAFGAPKQQHNAGGPAHSLSRRPLPYSYRQVAIYRLV